MYTTADGEDINPALVTAIRKSESGNPNRRVVCLSGGERVSVSVEDAERISTMTKRHNEAIANLRLAIHDMWAQR